ncbi:SPOSA6832_04628 [Sporobolomyces salmonicolor]|uniref:glutamate decarboxylase n=1 Tax=Sporidiobolus salmonicolor TaxID=5005 RepID=A0A0D6ET78_SPOSA|nr:SPOSA6832_04628 [Sporobolomyces salmonicolor]
MCPTEDHHVSSIVYGRTTNLQPLGVDSAAARQGIKRFELPDEEMDSRLAQRFVQDELLLDASPALNLASFVTTYMEPEAEQLMLQNLSKNFIDAEEYPSCAEVEMRCVNMIARLFNAPLDDPTSEALGVSTVGSSEAIILAVLAAKARWKEMRLAAGKDASKPNIVMNAAVQVCWEKAARYLEVEEKYWYCRPGQYVLDPQEAIDLVDENTILVVGILGTTYTGQYEPIEKLNALLEEKCQKTPGLDVYIHVQVLSRVASINASGHKYGLCYAGVGWALWRGKQFLPDSVCFTVNYLGSPQVSFTLNFSKPAINVIAQYCKSESLIPNKTAHESSDQFLRLGKAGYRAIMETLTSTADYVAEEVMKLNGGDFFELLSEGQAQGLPLVAWRIVKADCPYDDTMAPHTEEMKLLRVVTFLRDLKDTLHYLDHAPAEIQKHLSKSEGSGTLAVAASRVKHSKKQNVHLHEKHSLQGKYGKTHAIC